MFYKERILGFFLFAAFLYLSVLVYLNKALTFDAFVTFFLQSVTPRVFDFPFSVLSFVGAFEIGTLIFLLMLAVWKKINKIIVLFGYGIVSLFEVFGKSLIAQIPPPIELLRTKIFFPFPTGEISQALYAYPSGHSSRTAFVSLILLFVILKNNKFSKKQKQILFILILTFDFLMFYSRVYLAEHWASDVLGGVILGFSIALLSAPFLFKKNALK